MSKSAYQVYISYVIQEAERHTHESALVDFFNVPRIK